MSMPPPPPRVKQQDACLDSTLTEDDINQWLDPGAAGHLDMHLQYGSFSSSSTLPASHLDLYKMAEDSKEAHPHSGRSTPIEPPQAERQTERQDESATMSDV